MFKVFVFTQENCDKCVELKEKIVNRDYDFEIEYIDDVDILKKHQISAVPVILFKDGEIELDRKYGVIDSFKLIELCNKLR